MPRRSRACVVLIFIIHVFTPAPDDYFGGAAVLGAAHVRARCSFSSYMFSFPHQMTTLGVLKCVSPLLCVPVFISIINARHSYTKLTLWECGGVQRRSRVRPVLIFSFPGCSWLLLAASGCFWLFSGCFLAASGCSWLPLSPSGFSWLPLMSTVDLKKTTCLGSWDHTTRQGTHVRSK
jgi:hypothetical protein